MKKEVKQEVVISKKKPLAKKKIQITSDGFMPKRKK